MKLNPHCKRVLELSSMELTGMLMHCFPYKVPINLDHLPQNVDMIRSYIKTIEGQTPAQIESAAWCEERLGAPAIGNTVGLGKVEVHLDALWARRGLTYYFANEKDAALFKLFWG